MAETTDEIKRDIARTRDDMAQKLDLLQRKTNELKDWRLQVRFHPLLAMGLAVGLGLFAAFLTQPLRRQTYRMLTRP